MSKAWAIARHTIAEAVRMRVATVFLFLLAGLLASLPFVEGDGTLPGRVQAFLTYSISAVLVLTSLMTVFVGCGTVANEIHDRQIHTIACKPIPRWQYVFGKCMGLVVFDAMLLLISGLTIYGSVLFVRSRPQYDEAARADLQHQVMTARFAARPARPEDAIHKAVEERFQRLREQGPLPEFVPDPERSATRLAGTPENIKKILQHEIEQDWLRVQPGESRTYLFENLLIDPVPEKRIYIRYKVAAEVLPPDLIIRFGWTVGDRSKGATAFGAARLDTVERFHEIEFPATAVASDKTLAVTFHNVDLISGTVPFATPISLGKGGSLEVLFAVGTFEGNLVRAFGMVFCILIFLAAFSVFTSTWLSFPVACLVTMFVWITGMAMGFLNESMESVISTNTQEQLTGIVLTALRSMGKAVLWTMPDFSEFNPISRVADGRVVTLVWLLRAIGNLVLLKGLLAGLIGAVIYQNRELAQVTA